MKRKICLSIETTARHLGLALYEFQMNGKPRLLRSFFEEIPARQSDLLVPALDRLMRSARVSKDELALVAVDAGPGSFTGVRVGLAAARAMAQALGIPLAGVNSLEAIAWAAVTKNKNQLVVPWIPALAGEVYFAAYRGQKTILEPRWDTERAMKRFLIQHRVTEKIGGPPHPCAIAEIGIHRFEKNPRGALFHYENALPMYLQPSWAERTKT